MEHLLTFPLIEDIITRRSQKSLESDISADILCRWWRKAMTRDPVMIREAMAFFHGLSLAYISGGHYAASTEAQWLCEIAYIHLNNADF